MNDPHFDDLTRDLAGPSRRGIFSAAGAAALALLLGGTEPEIVGAKKKKKKTICHSGQTMKVPKAKVKAHLGHGDSLGPCPAPSVVSPPPPGPQPEPGCPAGQRECPGRGGCIAQNECCVDSDCGAPPEVGATCGANGTCTCGSGPGNPFKVCEGAPGICSICCATSECPEGTACERGACRCPSGGCDCAAAATPPSEFADLIACGPGTRCFCYFDMDDTQAPFSARCGVFEFPPTCPTPAECTTSITCAFNEFCGACGFIPANGGRCTTQCQLG